MCDLSSATTASDSPELSPHGAGLDCVDGGAVRHRDVDAEVEGLAAAVADGGSLRNARTGCWRSKGLTGQVYDQVRRALEMVMRTSCTWLVETMAVRLVSAEGAVAAVPRAAGEALAARAARIAKARTEAKRGVLWV